MTNLPDELWSRIMEIGIEKSKNILSYKDLCCISITCRRLKRLSNQNSIWAYLGSSDFPQFVANSNISLSDNINQHSAKTLYRIRFERDRARKVAAHQRAVLRVESRIAQHLRKLEEVQHQKNEELKRMKVTVLELSNLRKASAYGRLALMLRVLLRVAGLLEALSWVSPLFTQPQKMQFLCLKAASKEALSVQNRYRMICWLTELLSTSDSDVQQASVALNVWQPEVVRGSHKQIVEQSPVPAVSRSHALEMELKLCKQQIMGFDNAYRDETRRLEVASEQLASLKYHPLRVDDFTNDKIHLSGVKRKKKGKERIHSKTDSVHDLPL